MDVTNLKAKLTKYHQSHLLDFIEDKDVTDEMRKAYVEDLETIDFEEMNFIFEKTMGSGVGTGEKINGSEGNFDINERMEPIPDKLYASVNSTSDQEREEFKNIALDEIGQGHVGVILLAGGQGTRLGVHYPKGMYNVGLPSGKSLYQIQIERVKRLEQMAKERTGKDSTLTMYVMTSEHTKGATVEFFKKNGYFGMMPEQMVFFEQRMIPCFGNDGRYILQGKARLARAPDGNGGLYWALKHEKTLDDMKERGIKYLHVYCVDNILVKVADPWFIGYCVKKGAEAGNKVCEKVSPQENVGVVCKVNGKYRVVEYSEISRKNAEKQRENGRLVYNAGNICNHFFTTDFLDRMVRDHNSNLTYHIGRKNIPTIGNIKIEGVKLEKFVFDAFEFANTFCVWECLREEEFSPLKNADGPGKQDTPTTARTSLLNLHKIFLERAGAKLTENIEVVEISPLVSYSGENIESRVSGKTFSDSSVIIDH